MEEVFNFKFNEQCNPRQISLTGVRAIVLLALLSAKPCTFDEIRDFFIRSNIVDRKYSIDTIRIDLNTLKYIGCDISKATKKTNNKYILKSHPFELKITKEEVTALAKVYKSIYKNLSIERLLEYDELFNKLSGCASDDDIKEQIKGISVFKNINKELLNELLVNMKKNNKLTILYSSNASVETEFDITVEKIGFRSDKLYVYCYNHSIQKRTFLNFTRFKCILSNHLRGDIVETKDYIIEFNLKNYKNYSLEEKEEIMDVNNGIALIKGAYYTEFIAMQRVLSFGSDCIVLNPVDLKEKLIAKLRSMRKQYD